MSAAPKCQIACSYCRGRKVRCTGGVRCRNCIDHGKDCVYPLPQRKKRRKDGPESILLERRLAQVEALLQLPKGQELAETVQNPAPYEPPLASPSDTMRNYSMQSADRPRQASIAHISPTNTYAGLGYDEEGRLEEASNTLASLRAAQSPHNTLCRAQSTTDSSALTSDYFKGESTNTTPQTHIDQEENIISPYNVNWEHHGPGSWLSICSCRGIQWVTDRTSVPDFAKIARQLTMGFTKRLKLDSSICRDRAPELDPDTAWRYASAYFDECHYAIFGVVHRPAFETRLRAQFANPSEFQDDPSWYALRNAVYASGCRVMLSKDPSMTFNEAQAESWKYFENSLSMHTELIYTPTGLAAVQALTLMSFYCEGLGSPVLEYMLCSNAARLAQSKGLHRQAAKAWNLPESEILHRNWLFWAIYCCEKAIAARSGRPSGIDDDNISCAIPTAIVSESTIDMELFTHAIHHAQISSEISKRLVSVSAFRRTPLELIEKVSSLHQSLEEWRAQLPLHLQPGALRNPLKLSNAKNNINFTYIHFAYYGSLMAIHTVFTYPWITAMFGPAPTPATRDQVALSTSIVAEAARNIILTTRYIDMDAASPAWLSFYFPMVGLINLFVSILKYPSSAAAQSDVALLDSAAGHFGHMEFITANEQAFPFTREVAALARNTVAKARDFKGMAGDGENWTGVRNEGSDTRPGTGVATGTNGSEDASTVREASMSANMEVDPWNDLDVLSAIDFDMESWNVFSSMPMDDMAGGGHEASVFGKGLPYPTN